MATRKKPAAPAEIYQLKVMLVGAKPPIWRRVLVPAAMTFAQLHDVLQIVMGWQNYHMHDFRIGRHISIRARDPEGDLFGSDDDYVNERAARLFEYINPDQNRAIYTYDFGDNWEHSLLLEDVVTPNPKLKYPFCTAGKRRCPPEDCGGLYGYYDLLEILNDPRHPEHAERLEWIGGPIDPSEFSVDDVNEQLQPRRKRAVPS